MVSLSIAAGIGKPLSNLNVLPYEQSFFSGGLIALGLGELEH